MKEIDIIEEQLESIRKHSGNINSNLGGNLPWKENSEEIISNTSNISSEFNVALHGICHVINKIDSFVKSVSENYSNHHEYTFDEKLDIYNLEPNHLLDENQEKNANCNLKYF